MKNLELISIGVNKLSTTEMIGTDSGIIWLLVIGGALLPGAASYKTITSPTIIIGNDNKVVINSDQSADSTLNGNTARVSVPVK